MKNKQHWVNWSVIFFSLTVVLTLFSWIGSIYGMKEVQSLLSAEGVRWVLGHVVENYVQSPALGVVLILMMGLGIGKQAGLYEVLRRLCNKEKQLSRKERRALTLASMTLGVFCIVVLITLMLPWNFLQSVTGDWLYSPFSKGLVYIFSIGIGLSGMTYGYVSGAFRRLSDVVDGMSSLIVSRASYFVSLFFTVQFFSSLFYTRLADSLSVNDEFLSVVYIVFCYLPLFDFKGRNRSPNSL